MFAVYEKSVEERFMGEGEQRDDDLIRGMINSGTEIAGGAAGGALGFLAAGPAGAVLFGAAGAAMAVVLRKVGVELSERFLGPREKVRAGAVLALAVEEVQRRMAQGEQLRDDSFFKQASDGHSEGEEVVESILLKSQREPEERKLPFMAHLLAAIGFDRGLSAGMAQQLTKLAEQLTYRQLCILKMAATREQFELRNANYREQGHFSRPLLQLLYECHDLYGRGLMSNGEGVALGLTDIVPASLSPQGFGAELFNLMRLGEIPVEDVSPIAQQLRT